MKIDLPSIQEQQQDVFLSGIKAAIKQLEENLHAPRLPPPPGLIETDRRHLLRKREGWIAPEPSVVKAYFWHFQEHFPQYGTDAKLAALLGLSGDRRIREYKEGTAKVPYGVWREFLVITGRVPQDVLRVLAIFE